VARKRGISAWLVTWDFAGEHSRDALRRLTGSDDEVVAVLSPRLGPKTMRRFVEQRYADIWLSAPERLDYVSGRRNLSPAEYGEHMGQIICGDNPWLYARKVNNLRAVDHDRFEWEERPGLSAEMRAAVERIKRENAAAAASRRP
jgi:hypothetical protein